jgi:hypothetical protein
VNGTTPEAKNDDPHDFLIDTLGTKFLISSYESPAFLDKVLAKYNTHITNTKNLPGMEGKGPLRIAILTGFRLCAEISKLKNQVEKEQTSVEQELDRIAWNLISCIDQAIEETKSKEPNILDE